MKDADEKSRNDAASEMFESYVRTQLRAPLESEELYLGSPKLVIPYGPSDEDSSFWRIAVISRKYSRVVGFFDVRRFSEHPVIIRVSRLPRRDIKEEKEISALPVDILELTHGDIYDQAKKTFGDSVRLIGSPELVFDRAETRVAWKVDLEKGEKEFRAMVTPGYAYLVS